MVSLVVVAMFVSVHALFQRPLASSDRAGLCYLCVPENIGTDSSVDQPTLCCSSVEGVTFGADEDFIAELREIFRQTAVCFMPPKLLLDRALTSVQWD